MEEKPVGGNPKRKFNILVLSDIGGATKYMSDDNLIGMAQYLRNIPTEDKPNMLVINGGILPFFPQRGSNRSNDYLDVIMENLQYIRDTAAVMKPHLERLVAQTPEDCKIIYITSESDQRNIDEYIRDLGLDFKFHRERIEDRMGEEIELIAGRKAIISAVEHSKAAAEQQIAQNPNNKKILEELKNIEIKLKVNTEERTEAEHRLELLNSLYLLTLNNLEEDQIKKTLEEKIEDEKAVSEEFKTVEKDTAKYEELVSRAKKIANSIRLLNNRLADVREGNEKASKDKENKQVDIFVHNAITSRGSHSVINELAHSYYMTELRNAFGRKRDITIQSEKVSLEEHNSGAFSFNVITSNDPSVLLGTRKRQSNNIPANRLEILTVNGVLDKKALEAKLLNIFVTGKHDFTSFSIEPLKNGSPSELVLLSQGPFWSTKGLASMWNAGINTKDTQAVEKGYLSSGASFLRIPENEPIEHEILSDRYLYEKRKENDKEESRKLKRRLRNLKNSGKKQNNDEAHLRRKELDLAVAMNKRPSELKDYELSDIASSGNLEKMIARKDEKPLRGAINLKIAAFSDVHVGNHSKLKLLDAAISDAIKRQPNIMVLDGDMLEGLLNYYAVVTRYGNTADFPQKYEAALKQLGFSEAEVYKKMSEMLRENIGKSIHNIDEQPDILLGHMWRLIDDVILRGGAVIAVSGNHYNNTHREWRNDESTNVVSHIKAHLKGYLEISEASGIPDKKAYEMVKKALESDNRVMGIGGSEFGADQIRVDGIETMASHELGTGNPGSMVGFVEKKRTNAVLHIAGHDHVCQVATAGGELMIKIPSMQDAEDNPFLKRIQIPIGTTPLGSVNGYTFMDLDVDGNAGEVLRSKVISVLERDLIAEDKVDRKIRDMLRDVRIERTKKSKTR